MIKGDRSGWGPVLQGEPGTDRSPTSPCRNPDVQSNMHVDGSRYAATMRLDTNEHIRRSVGRLGALTGAGLLHALWELPLGIPWPIEQLSLRDLETLREAESGWITIECGHVERRYRPPGRVVTVMTSDRSLAGAVKRVSSHPPTVQRIALWTRESQRPYRNIAFTVDLAKERGIGIIVEAGGDREVLVSPRAAVIGRPSIYRWWQAELVYRNWLMSTPPTGSIAPSA